jgi:hypothetical protein
LAEALPRHSAEPSQIGIIFRLTALHHVLKAKGQREDLGHPGQTTRTVNWLASTVRFGSKARLGVELEMNF